MFLEHFNRNGSEVLHLAGFVLCQKAQRNCPRLKPELRLLVFLFHWGLPAMCGSILMYSILSHWLMLFRTWNVFIHKADTLFHLRSINNVIHKGKKLLNDSVLKSDHKYIQTTKGSPKEKLSCKNSTGVG